jgi:phosphatidylserine/phosphatidylglycerophosphate/cardiolipin synthase-like enzyme
LILCLISSAGSSERKWEVYFTNPSKIKKTGVINPQDGLISAIRKTEKSFYGAFYDISSLKTADALIAAHNRGVDVKLVTENDTFSGEAITRLLESGIRIVPDTGSGLMHNKFAVIDGTSVFTGSYNTTENCTLKNNNNALLIRSPELAGIYTGEFSEMFDSAIFGNRKEEGAFASLQKKYYVKLDDMNINVYFAPEDNVEKIIFDRISKAEKSIRFMQFSFTSDEIGELIIRKFKDGINVEGVFEKKGSDTEYSEYTKMKIEDLPVRLDGNKAVMHHKVIIIDDFLVITGSFNISKNANLKNDENIIIIGSTELALQYLKEFSRIYKEAGR